MINLIARLLVVGALLTGSIAFSADDKPAAKDRFAEVEELLAQLGAPALATRDATERKLVALGPELLTVLPQGDAALSPEVRSRLVRVRRALEVEFAESAGKPSRITLRGELAVAEIIAELAKQSGNRIVDLHPEDTAKRPAITVAFDKSPFWQAFDEVLEKARLASVPTPRGERSSRALFIAPREQVEKPTAASAQVAYKGPFRVAARATRSKEGVARLALEVAWEPRLSPIAMTVAASGLVATDETGAAILAASPTAQWSTASLSGQTKVAFDIPLAMTDKVSKLVSLRTKLSVLLPGNELAFRFGDIDSIIAPTMRAVPRANILRRGDATVRLESFRREDDVLKAQFRVVYNDPQDAVQSHHGWLYESRAKLVDAAGKEIAPSSFDANAAEDGVQGAYTFPAIELTGAALVYSTPAVIVTAPVEVEIKGVPVE